MAAQTKPQPVPVQINSTYVDENPETLTGLAPPIANLFANGVVESYDDDFDFDDADVLEGQYVNRRAIDTPVAIATNRELRGIANVARTSDTDRNPIAMIGTGKSRSQYDISTYLQKPTTIPNIIGVKALPTEERLVAAATVFEDAYFKETSLLKNQPFLLDVNAIQTDEQGVSRPINFWAQILNESGTTASSVEDPATNFVYGRLIAVSGNDALRKSFETPLNATEGKMYGPPSAIIPTLVLGYSMNLGMPTVGFETIYTQDVVEEFINKMLTEHPQLASHAFDQAIFQVAFGVPDLGVEIFTVMVQNNQVQVTAEEKAAFNRISAAAGFNKAVPEKKVSPAVKKNESLSDIINKPYILGLDAVQGNPRPAKVAAATAPSKSDQELAGIARAKMYSDDMYVATIIYKKGFDAREYEAFVRGASLIGLYDHWMINAPAAAQGNLKPTEKRKVSMSRNRVAFANGTRAPSVLALVNLANQVDRFLSLDLSGFMSNYEEGRFEHSSHILGSGVPAYDSSYEVAGNKAAARRFLTPVAVATAASPVPRLVPILAPAPTSTRLSPAAEQRRSELVGEAENLAAAGEEQVVVAQQLDAAAASTRDPARLSQINAARAEVAAETNALNRAALPHNSAVLQEVAQDDKTFAESVYEAGDAASRLEAAESLVKAALARDAKNKRVAKKSASPKKTGAPKRTRAKKAAPQQEDSPQYEEASPSAVPAQQRLSTRDRGESRTVLVNGVPTLRSNIETFAAAPRRGGL